MQCIRVLNGITDSKEVHIPIPRACGRATSYGKRDFVDVMRDQEIGRVSCISQVGPKCGRDAPYKRESQSQGRRRCDDRNRGESGASTEMRNLSRLWTLEKARSLQEERSPAHTLILAPKTHFGLLTSRTLR